MAFSQKNVQSYAPWMLLFLRLGIAAIFLYFGILALIHPIEESGWIAPWIESLLPFSSVTFVWILGLLETIVGAMLLLGLYVRYVAFASSLLLLGVVINLGFTPTALRDLIILFGALALATSSSYKWTLWSGETQ